jgi:hypothetical protein
MLRKIFPRLRPLFGGVLLMVLVLSGGCASGPKWDDAQRNILEQRVRDRFQALVARDFEKVWEYSTPSYRAIFSKQLYAKKFSYAVELQLTGVEVVNYDSDAAVASVVVRVMSKPTKQTSTASMLIGATPSSLGEKWVFSQGQWWFSVNY